MSSPKPQTVDEYIVSASPQVKKHLIQLRMAILSTAPQAQESIGFDMPVYKLNGVLVYFGGFSKHVSLFPGPHAIEAFQEELTEYKIAKGTIQFSVDKPIPIRLVKKIVKFKMRENLTKNR